MQQYYIALFGLKVYWGRGYVVKLGVVLWGMWGQKSE
jgi:hypothetical protein